MTNRNRSRSRSRVRTPRLRTVWHGDFTLPTTVNAGNQAFVNLTTLLLDITESPLFKQGLTLLRTFLTLWLNSADATLSADSAHGLIMADGDAIASSALLDPNGNIGAPWLYWDARSLLPASDSGQQQTLDIKSKRRFHGNDANLVWIINNTDGVQALEFALAWRLLIGMK